jgi:hypothetical protein
MFWRDSIKTHWMQQDERKHPVFVWKSLEFVWSGFCTSGSLTEMLLVRTDRLIKGGDLRESAASRSGVQISASARRSLLKANRIRSLS